MSCPDWVVYVIWKRPIIYQARNQIIPILKKVNVNFIKKIQKNRKNYKYAILHSVCFEHAAKHFNKWTVLVELKLIGI